MIYLLSLVHTDSEKVFYNDNNTCMDCDSGGVRIARGCLRSTPPWSTGLTQAVGQDGAS